MKKLTEQSSNYDNLEKMSVLELLENMNKEDNSVPKTIQKVLPDIEVLINKIVSNMKKGGRLFYIGCGTSGRLGILDASECPPTFGVSENKVIGIISGGDVAIRKAVEFAEDSESEGWEDLKKYNINTNDTVIGIAASGSTPYVVSTIKKCNQKGISTGCITCNEESPLAKNAQMPIVALVGPEFVTGSTRMKAGTAQKLILNMISTSTMIKLGHVQGNKMVDMQLSNHKLVDRGTKMIMEGTSLDYETAKKLLLKHGSVRKAVDSLS
ncbi:MAG: N-acetylmuramic acid 6-phosphate etherase [Flavobacteriales bacterium]|nr:N-acetylmuramic acid 6-phosphate etherase [Flavobacteriales bacterium]|tara:strand:- start:1047 stop:1850 length:804 start_codon:yes stop_codon:yes gene_type:complete